MRIGIAFVAMISFLFIACDNPLGTDNKMTSYSNVTIKLLDETTGNPIVFAMVAIEDFPQQQSRVSQDATLASGEVLFENVYVGLTVNISVGKNTVTELYIYEGEQISLSLTESQTYTIRIKNTR